MEKQDLNGPSIKERMQLRLHKEVCVACKRYSEQSVLINNALDRFHQGDLNIKMTLSEGTRSRITEELKKREEVY